MSTMLWIQLAVGVLIVCVGLIGPFGLRPLRIHIVVLGLINALYPAAILLTERASLFRTPAIVLYVILVLGVFVSIPRNIWNEARWTVLLGAGTIAALVALHFLHDGASPLTQVLLAGLVGVFAISFVVASLAGTFHAVSRLRP